jgi:acyl-CoA synthetase (AMP-forming)/AMP-acid ligase II
VRQPLDHHALVRIRARHIQVVRLRPDGGDVCPELLLHCSLALCHLVDRVKDMIIRGGENIYPKEIEDALHAHPAVLEAAVVGQPDPVFGEQPVAFVVLRPGFRARPEDLIGHCREPLARYKVPRAVFIEEMLPKNAVGKVAKPVLRERLKDAGAAGDR